MSGGKRSTRRRRVTLGVLLKERSGWAARRSCRRLPPGERPIRCQGVKFVSENRPQYSKLPTSASAPSAPPAPRVPKRPPGCGHAPIGLIATIQDGGSFAGRLDWCYTIITVRNRTFVVPLKTFPIHSKPSPRVRAMNRQKRLHALRQTPIFDLLIIGGGATGCGYRPPTPPAAACRSP